MSDTDTEEVGLEIALVPTVDELGTLLENLPVLFHEDFVSEEIEVMKEDPSATMVLVGGGFALALVTIADYLRTGEFTPEGIHMLNETTKMLYEFVSHLVAEGHRTGMIPIELDL